MKKCTLLFLSILLILSLAGCGGPAPAPQTEPQKAVETLPPPTETEAPTVPTEPPRREILKSWDGEPDDAYELDTPDYAGGFPKIQGMVLYEKDGIRVTMGDCTLKPEFYNERGDRVARPSGGLKPGYMVYYSIPLTLENQTDVNIRMSSFDFAINQKAIITTSGGAFSDAAPHSKVKTECSFFQSDINRNARGMALPRDFEIVLTFFDVDNGERIGSSDVIRFSSDVDPDYAEPVEPYPLLLWEDELVAVRAGEMYQRERGNVRMEFSVENKFDEPLTVTGVDIAINGEPVELRLSRWIIPGAADYQAMEITAKELKAWGLTYEDLKTMDLTITCTRHYEEEVLSQSDRIQLDLVDKK